MCVPSRRSTRTTRDDARIQPHSFMTISCSLIGRHAKSIRTARTDDRSGTTPPSGSTHLLPAAKSSAYVQNRSFLFVRWCGLCDAVSILTSSLTILVSGVNLLDANKRQKQKIEPTPTGLEPAASTKLDTGNLRLLESAMGRYPSCRLT